MQDEHSSQTTNNLNKSSYDHRPKRKSRDKPNPKIWRDEYVTSITGKRKSLACDTENKSADDVEGSNEKVNRKIAK